MPALHPRVLTFGAVAVLAASACSTFDPNVGPLQNDGAAASTCALGASGYGTSYGSPSGQAAANAFCTADGGTLEAPCDVCEATNCCTQRVACYTAEGCSCADTALNGCMAAAAETGEGGGTDDAAAAAASRALAACWSAFESTSATAKSRYQCLTNWCSAQCQIPK